MTIDLRNRVIVALQDLTAVEILYLLDLAAKLKQDRREGRERHWLEGKNIVLIFEKPSTRTRCAFEVAAYSQGAHVTYLDAVGSHIGKKESLQDTAKVLGRYYDAIEYRGSDQDKVEQLARNAGVPVFNGLTNTAHPTQALADLLTMSEYAAKPLDEVAVCFLGDAAGNVAHSLLTGGASLGMDVRCAAPRDRWPSEETMSASRRLAAVAHGRVTVSDSLEETVPGADFVYTDVWLSMGESEDQWQERISMMLPFRVTSELMAAAGEDAKFMHCLPAFHDRNTEVGEAVFQRFGIDCMEVTDEVFQSPASIVLDQAENRIHTIKAVMVATLSEIY